MHRYLQLVRRREFALLWGGATISALGDGMSFVALVWLLIERGGDAAMVGAMAAAYTAPVIVGGLAAGVVLDRFDRRLVLAGDNAIRGLAMASIPVASALGVLTVAHLFVVAAVYGLLYMTSLAGIPSLISGLVGDAELTTANAMESLTYGISGLVGPVLAGAIIALLGATMVMAIDALTYAVFVGCLLAMRRPQPPMAATEPGEGIPSVGGGIGAAVRFVLGAPAILAITVIYMTINIGEGIFMVLAPVYARDVLDGASAAYGALVSAFAGGSLVGLALVGAIDWRWPLGRSIAVATTLTGLVLAPLALRPPFGTAVGVLAVAGIFASSLTPWAQTIRMRLIPPQLRGRVFALLRTLMQATPPIGAVLGGLLLDNGSVALVALVMAGLIAIPGAVGLFLPALGSEATGEGAGERPDETAAQGG
jgi:MFS family permease